MHFNTFTCVFVVIYYVTHMLSRIVLRETRQTFYGALHRRDIAKIGGKFHYICTRTVKIHFLDKKVIQLNLYIKTDILIIHFFTGEVKLHD